jgi:hypothetical protein
MNSNAQVFNRRGDQTFLTVKELRSPCRNSLMDLLQENQYSHNDVVQFFLIKAVIMWDKETVS